MRWIHRTLLRYHRDNIPITSLDLQFGIHAAFRSAYKLIMQAASKSSLNELHLRNLTASFTLPDEIFSSENLHTLSLKLIFLGYWKSYSLNLYVSSNPAIHCTNLRVLELVYVHISQEVLNKLLSTCKLLQKIDIKLSWQLKSVKVNNLRYLHELRINLNDCYYTLEVDNVPSLRLLVYHASWMMWRKPTLFKMGTIGSLRELYLDNVSMDDAFSSMIKSSFPFLESLTLIIKWCSVEILNIRCPTLRSLNLCFRQDKPQQEQQQIKLQVYAPNLLRYSHASMAMPTLLFLTIPPKQIELSLRLYNPIDELFFIKMREALELSSKFNINILAYGDGVLVPAFNIDDMRTILPFPATIFEELVFFITDINSVLWENSLLFDAFFSICHPIYVKANTELTLTVANYFLSLIGKVYCEIRNPLNGSWVALTSSSLSLHTTTPRGCIFKFDFSEFEFSEFKLSWCSP
uniref:F-box/LRR-repeat protein 15/At3g58940/PEG3-like LRR domain-containing protein n=1 Tax=Tanacetum cinerariifolium TaxID=118510 RepID=A0A699GML3_TANCI|nr:hypothetical protein [Tanacetum cinerariifolium]